MCSAGTGWDGEGRYCASIEEMHALVEPLPFVPAMWTSFRRSKSDGWMYAQPRGSRRWTDSNSSHLISQSSHPSYHLRNSLPVHAFSVVPNRFYDGKIRLQCVEGHHGVLRELVLNPLGRLQICMNQTHPISTSHSRSVGGPAPAATESEGESSAQ